MISEIGTATDLENLFTKIVDFVTTNASLVAANQHWLINRIHRDGLASYTTNLTEIATAAGRRIPHSFRDTPRTLNTNNINSNENYTYCTGFSAGVSYVAMTLRAAKEIKNVRIVSAPGSDSSYTLQNFLLQYSDNGSTWTTALTVSSNPTYQQTETKDFAVPGSPGAHVYWRILMNSAQSASTLVSRKSMLLQLADGTIANHYGSEVLFKARGNAGTENIYMGMRSEYDSSNGWYNWFLCGFTGYNPSVKDFFLQPGCINGYGDATPMTIPMIPCWNTNMPYWLSANGRSLRIGVKVSTNFESGYMGFLLPYASPAQYPYPLVIGGSLVPQSGARGVEWRYSYNSYRHSAYPNPGGDNPNSVTSNATLYLRTPDGIWRSSSNRSTSDANALSRAYVSGVFPYTFNGPYLLTWPFSTFSSLYTDGVLPFREVLGGGYMMLPTVLVMRSPNVFIAGELEGVFSISGFSNASENTFTYNGSDFVVMQNISRTDIHEYFAMQLT